MTTSTVGKDGLHSDSLRLCGVEPEATFGWMKLSEDAHNGAFSFRLLLVGTCEMLAPLRDRDNGEGGISTYT